MNRTARLLLRNECSYRFPSPVCLPGLTGTTFVVVVLFCFVSCSSKIDLQVACGRKIDGRIILRWIFRKWEGVVDTGWSWLRIGTGGGHL